MQTSTWHLILLHFAPSAVAYKPSQVDGDERDGDDHGLSAESELCA